MLRNFDDVMTEPRQARVTSPTVLITEQVTITQRPSEARAFVAKDDVAWGWDDLRDYVVAQIEQRFGVFPRDAKKEAGTFKSFLSRYGDKAPAIARHAFEICDGFWGGAPISVNRFCKGSDPYFADKIVARLSETTVQAW